MQSDDFITRVEKGLLRAVGTLVLDVSESNQRSFAVALSGGSDSVALLAAMEMICRESAWSLRAAHVNHKTRGDESDRDAIFCEALCSKLGVPFHTSALQPSQYPLSEETLRNARYGELERLAKLSGCRFLLTAHTLDDQAETMLFRLFRGTGPLGLVGIPARRKLSGDLTLARPLLSLSRSECRAFLSSLAMTWVNDSSNESILYNRNYIRAEVIPIVEKRFPKIKQHLQQLNDILSEEQLLLHRQMLKQRALIQTGNAWRVSTFLNEPAALQRRLIAGALQDHNVQPSFELIEQLRASIEEAGTGCNGRRKTCTTLSRDVVVKVSADTVIWEQKRADGAAESAPPQVIALPGRTFCRVTGKTLSVSAWENGVVEDFPEAAAHEAFVDLSNIQCPLVLRARRPGDVIQPLGMEQAVRLKKFIHTRKSSIAAAPIMLVADREEVLWVPGMGLSQKIRVAKKPTHVFRWESDTTGALLSASPEMPAD